MLGQHFRGALALFLMLLFIKNIPISMYSIYLYQTPHRYMFSVGGCHMFWRLSHDRMILCTEAAKDAPILRPEPIIIIQC